MTRPHPPCELLLSETQLEAMLDDDSSQALEGSNPGQFGAVRSTPPRSAASCVGG